MAQATAAEVTLQRESLAGLWEALIPLVIAHRTEVDPGTAPIDLDRDAYEEAEQSGYLRLYTVRDAEWKLRGYALMTVGPNAHARLERIAKQDMLYVEPACRGAAGARLLAFAEDQLRAEGVAEVFHDVLIARDFSPVLERQGYRHVATTYAKRLDRE